MKFPVADLDKDDTRQVISAHLEALHDSDTAQMVVFTWWAGDEPIGQQEAPGHLMLDVPPAPAGATHLTIKERKL